MFDPENTLHHVVSLTMRKARMFRFAHVSDKRCASGVRYGTLRLR